jgi:hypothetical protein
MIRDADPKQFDVAWVDGMRQPQNKANPAYPAGLDINAVPPGGTGCRVALPYPAKRIGRYVIECKLCELRVAVTTAGRADDPRSVAMPCKVGAASEPAPR